MHGEKVGHLKGISAKLVAPIMDNPSLSIKIEGTIPRKGDHYKLPLLLEYYAVASSADMLQVSQSLTKKLVAALKRDADFRLGNRAVSVDKQKPIVVRRKRLDWNQQQQALDDLFDKQLEKQYEDLPHIDMPDVFSGVKLFDHQVKGIKWMVKQETEPRIPPFYQVVKESGKKVRFHF